MAKSVLYIDWSKSSLQRAHSQQKKKKKYRLFWGFLCIQGIFETSEATLKAHLHGGSLSIISHLSLLRYGLPSGPPAGKHIKYKSMLHRAWWKSIKLKLSKTKHKLGWCLKLWHVLEDIVGSVVWWHCFKVLLFCIWSMKWWTNFQVFWGLWL